MEQQELIETQKRIIANQDSQIRSYKDQIKAYKNLLDAQIHCRDEALHIVETLLIKKVHPDPESLLREIRKMLYGNCEDVGNFS